MRPEQVPAQPILQTVMTNVGNFQGTFNMDKMGFNPLLPVYLSI